MKLLYFAWVRERIGKPEEEIELPAGVATVRDLMQWLAGSKVRRAACSSRQCGRHLNN